MTIMVTVIIYNGKLATDRAGELFLVLLLSRVQNLPPVPKGITPGHDDPVWGIIVLRVRGLEKGVDSSVAKHE